MTNYDSDSSEDASDYTTTNVILGYASTESSGDEVSHIGGHPVWLDENVTPPRSLSRCKNCSGYLSLLLQLNADLQKYFPHDTRRIHVLSCRQKACSRKPGSMRAFREVRKPHAKQRTNIPNTTSGSIPVQQEQFPGLGTMLFGGKTSDSPGNTGVNLFSSMPSPAESRSNPFSNTNSSGSNSSALPASTSEPRSTATSTEALSSSFADKLKINAPSSPVQSTLTSESTEKWPDQASFPQPYPHFYLDAYPEELDSTPSHSTAADASTSKVSYDMDDEAKGGASIDEKDTFESTLDKTFQTFSDIVAQNPEQVLRYDFKGQPLLYSGADAVSSRFVVPHGKAGAVKGMPRCEACGAQRVFEMQLTPYLIFEIEKDDVMDIEDGMEWGTIIVGTCVNNCGTAGETNFREEWLGTQWEERVVRK